MHNTSFVAHPLLQRRKLLTVLASLPLAAAGIPRLSRAAATPGKARIAALPAADAILLYAAEKDGLFAQQGLDVEIIPFKSALEMTAAIRAGKIAGQYTNAMTTISQRANGIDLAVAVTTWHTSKNHRAFGFAISPKDKDKIRSLDDLRKSKSVTTSNSKGTITDWILYRMLTTEHVPQEALRTVEVAQIPIRLQMLTASRLQSALFYEPLLTLIEAKGGKVIWDDRSLNEPLSMIALARPYLTPQFVHPFRQALALAAKAVDAEPGKYLPLMVEKGLLPAAVAENFNLQKFSGFETADGLPPLPSEQYLQEAARWLVQKGILKQIPELSSCVYRG